MNVVESVYGSVEGWTFAQCHQSCSKLKYIPVYECGRKCIRILFKAYQDALPEDESSI